MPGVADQEKRTQRLQNQQQNKIEMENIIRLIKEDRLDEADPSQLETLRLALELKNAFDGNNSSAVEGIDSDALTRTIKQTILDALKDMPVSQGTPLSPTQDPARPKMKHMHLDLDQVGDGMAIEHDFDLGHEKNSQEDSTAKLEKLKRMKKPNGES